MSGLYVKSGRRARPVKHDLLSHEITKKSFPEGSTAGPVQLTSGRNHFGLSTLSTYLRPKQANKYPGLGRAILRWPARLVQVPLYKNSLALIASNGANAVLGMAFWIVAARTFPAEAVGQGAAAISALLLVSLLGWAGLQPTLIRFIGVAGRGMTRLLLWSYAIAAVSALAASLGFLLGTRWFVSSLQFLNDGFGLPFIAAVVMWTAFALQDSALTGLRRTVWIPLENASFGLIKIILLLLLAFWTDSPWAIFASWSLSALVLLIPVNLAIFTRFIPDALKGQETKPSHFTLRDVSRFAIGNHISALFIGIPDGVMPILVVAIAGPEAGAFFYAPRTLVMSVRLFAVSVANALVAEGSIAQAGVGSAAKLVRRASLFSIAIFLPVTLFFLIASEPILQTFGGEYAENGIDVLRFLALGLLPFAVFNIWLALARISRQVGLIVVLAGIVAIINLTLSIALLSWIGIEGVGMAWAIAQGTVALIASIVFLRAQGLRKQDLEP